MFLVKPNLLLTGLLQGYKQRIIPAGYYAPSAPSKVDQDSA